MVIHLQVSMIAIDDFANAFQTKSVFLLIGFIRVQSAVFCGKRIFSVGIYDRYHDKWRFFPPAYI